MFFKKVTLKNISHQIQVIRESGDDVGLTVCTLPDALLLPRLVILAEGEPWNVVDVTVMRGERGMLLTYKKKTSITKLADKYEIHNLRFDSYGA